MTARIAINGFGRIGRALVRQMATAGPESLQALAAVNDLTDVTTLAHLLAHDSVHGAFPGEVRVAGKDLMVCDHRIAITREKSPDNLPWRRPGVDVVIESTGRFTDRENAALHLQAGASHVVISAPGKDADLTLCYGVNHQLFDPAQHRVISNASCTTNCLAPVAKVLHENFGIVRGQVTTIHSYTNDQQILDLPHKDLRRARAAGLSMIPTTTGAAKAVGLVLPELAGKLDGLAVRVPTPNVSLVDLVAELDRQVTAEEVNTALRQAAGAELRGVLACCDEPLVSIDFCGNPHSSIVDTALTKVVGGRSVKVLAWYDNEMGYARRLFDVARLVAGL